MGQHAKLHFAMHCNRKPAHAKSAQANVLHNQHFRATQYSSYASASHHPCTYLGAYSFRMPNATHMRYISPSYRYTSQICAATSRGSVYVKVRWLVNGGSKVVR
jgi:hypothetical protein